MLLAPMIARLQGQPDLASALQTVVRDVVALHGAEFGNVQLLDERGYLWIVAHSGLSREFLVAAGRISEDASSVCARALRQRKTVYVHNVANDPLFLPFRDLAEHAPFRAVLSSPLCPSTGDCIGVVSVHFTNPRVATDIEIHTLESYCRTASDHLLSKQSAAEIARQAEKLHRSMLESQRSTA